jgi:putative ABC transport system permease protein
MIPLSYNVRSLTVRKTSTAAAVIGIALVVFVFAAVLMLRNGIHDTMATSGRGDNAIIMRFGSQTELTSGIDASQVGLIGAKSQVARAASGQPLAVGEVVVVILLDKAGTTGGVSVSNVQVRGTTDLVWDVRPEAQIVAGRRPQPGTDEVAIGAAIRGRFEGLELGRTVELKKNRPMKIVGVFAAGGSAFESEIWADIDQVRTAFGRQGLVSSVRVHLAGATKLDAFKADVESDKTLQLEVQRESTYYENSGEGTSTFVTILGVIVAVIFSFGAMIGAAITMYAQVANRTREIGTLRALGFSRFAVLGSFLTESILIALVGGLAGILLSLPMGFARFSTLNMATWSEVVFRFQTTPQILVNALIFSTVMGVIGGFLPAVRAARMSPLQAIRD